MVISVSFEPPFKVKRGFFRVFSFSATMNTVQSSLPDADLGLVKSPVKVTFSGIFTVFSSLYFPFGRYTVPPLFAALSRRFCRFLLSSVLPSALKLLRTEK